MYNLYIYDDLVASFDSEREVYSFIKYNFCDLIDDECMMSDDLADATDEYIIASLVDPSTDGLSLVYEG